MINYYTRSQFVSFGDSLDAQMRTEIRKRAEGRSPSNATFLSHSSKDSDVLVPVIRILESHGASVYIDKKDPALPPYTSKKTAMVLRDRIGQAKKFVLLASENSKDSRWVPWELGIADGRKSESNIAIFPVLEKQGDTQWMSWEYIGLYDRIVYGDLNGYSEPVWMVLDYRENIATELRQWLAR